MIFLVAATFCSAVRTSLAETATEECKSKPDGPSPPGTHWYYRINRADKRHCWYLGTIKEHSAAAEAGSRGDSAAPKTGESRSPNARRQSAGIEPIGLAAAYSKPVPADTAAAEVPPPQTSFARAASAPEPEQTRMAPGQTEPAVPSVTASAASAGSPLDQSSAATEFAVRWPDLPKSPASAMAAPALMGSSYAKTTAASDSQLAPSGAVAQQRDLAQVGPSSAGFRPTMVTSTLAIALLLAGAILQFARRPRQASRRDRRELAADWLDACSEIRTALPDMAGRNFAQMADSAGRRLSEAAEIAGRNLVRAAKLAARNLCGTAFRRLQPLMRGRSGIRPKPPVRIEPATSLGHDFKASLAQLMHDMRRAEAATEPPRTFAPDARHQLRGLLARTASRHSNAFDSNETTQLAREIASGSAGEAASDFSQWRRSARQAPAW
jgi:hypothetical protein